MMKEDKKAEVDTGYQVQSDDVKFTQMNSVTGGGSKGDVLEDEEDVIIIT